MKRRDGAPCETSRGCAKGHWRDKPDPSPSVLSIVNAYWSISAGCSSLLPDEYKSRWFIELFGEMERVRREIEEEKASAENRSVLRTLLRVIGS